MVEMLNAGLEQAHIISELRTRVHQLEGALDKLFLFISDGHEMDESRTWFWDDDIVAILKADCDRRHNV